MLKFAPLFSLKATVAAPVDAGLTPGGTRRIIPVTGGTFTGERVSGTLLPGGTDVQRIRDDGVAELTIHAVLATARGERILLKGNALRHAPPDIAARLARGEGPDPASYYFREAIMFETASVRLAWLNKILAIGTGRRNSDSVELDVFEIL
jgi:Protein of unknown function (DUF3237)